MPVLIMYRLTTLGYKLSHSTGNSTPEMKIVHYLARQHEASREAIYAYSGGDAGTLAKLVSRGVIERT